MKVWVASVSFGGLASLEWRETQLVLVRFVCCQVVRGASPSFRFVVGVVSCVLDA